MNELALFAGAGGSILAGKLLGWRTVCAVENDHYCQRVLLQRQRDGILPLFPIWDDVRTFDGTEWRGRVDVVTAGFPCQPFSAAGLKRAERDERNLWPDTKRILSEVRPTYAVLENAPTLVAIRYFDVILRDLAAIGFDAVWDCIPASYFGAHFVGEKLWIIASRSEAGGLRWKRSREVTMGTHQWGRDEFEGLVRLETQHGVPAGSYGRISDGVSHRVDRLRALGNGWVPIVGAKAWEMMTDSLDTPSQID